MSVKLTEEQREAIEWAAGQAYSYAKPITGESLMMKRWRALSELLAAQTTMAEPCDKCGLLDANKCAECNPGPTDHPDHSGDGGDLQEVGFIVQDDRLGWHFAPTVAWTYLGKGRALYVRSDKVDPVRQDGDGRAAPDIAEFSELIDSYQCAQKDGNHNERAAARIALMSAYRAALASKAAAVAAREPILKPGKNCLNTMASSALMAHVTLMMACVAPIPRQ
jgi:hypothetical protein